MEDAMCTLYPALVGCPNPSSTDDTDGDGVSDINEILNGTDPTDPNYPGVSSTSSSSNSSGSRRTGSALAKLAAIFGNTNTSLSSGDSLGGGETCEASTIITQNLKAPARNGNYHNYTKAIVTEAKILQAHMNRLGFNSGPEDGIIGPLTDGAIKRMQIFLGTTPDGFVGPITRGLINTSCGTTDQTQTTPPVAVAQPTSITTSSCSFTNAKPGDEGPNVLAIQNFLQSQGLLTATPNGFYGPATSAATRAFQNNYPNIYTSAGLTQASDWFYTNSIAQAVVLCEA